MTPSVRWFLGDKELDDRDDGITIESLSSESSFLTVESLTAGNRFMYTCTANAGMDHIRLDFLVTTVGESGVVCC